MPKIAWNKGIKGSVKPNVTSFKKGLVPWNKGIPRSEETKARIKETKRLRRMFYQNPVGEKHWSFKPGIKKSYSAIHRWIRRKVPKSFICEACGKEPGLTKVGKTKIHWANISGDYLEDVTDWKQLCISCHHTYDKKVLNFKFKKQPTT